MPEPAKNKKTNKSTKQQSVKSTRRKLKLPTYKPFKLAKKIKQPKPALPGSFRLFVRSMRLLRKNWKLFGGITLVYFLLTVVLVRSFELSIGASEIKTTLQEAFTGSNTQLVSSLAVFGVLLGSSSAANSEVAAAYQSVVTVMCSLALVWALRHRLSDATKKLRIRDSFYQGMYPLVPVILVLIVIGLQLVPLYLASFLYQIVFGTGLAVAPLEQIVWALFMLLLVVLSVYLLTSSVIALYIATLPNVTPMQALRSARELVRHRRFEVTRKLLFLPVAMIILAAVIIVPLIVLSPNVAEVVFVVLSSFSLAASHSYLYSVYRGLL